MKREDTYNKYIDDFLAGKSEQERVDFLEKDFTRRYSAVMAWKRRQEIKQAAEMSGVDDILLLLTRARMAVENAKSLSDEDLSKIDDAIDTLSVSVGRCREAMTQREIEALERQQQEIQKRLDRLKGRV